MHPELAVLIATGELSPALAARLDALMARVARSEERTPSGIDDDCLATMAGGAAERDALPPRYEDVAPIGVGGMGEVRRVRDRALGRTCAYKAIRKEHCGNSAAVARFVEEAQVAAQLQHPHIPPVYDAGRLADGRPWFTMKEVRGRTLGALIAEAHAGEVNDTVLHRLCDVLAKVCDAVGYAHGRGVVHRDLKPENVMVGPFGEVFVLDWGLAKVVGRPDHALADGDGEPEVETARSGDDALKTRAGRVMGTAAYMAPEQARGEVDRLDARSDVYALGAMLYEALSGRPPYSGGDWLTILQAVLSGPPSPPTRLRGGAASGVIETPANVTFGVDGWDALPGEPASSAPEPFELAEDRALPVELVSLCMRCLERDPVERPSDGLAVGAALRSWLDGSGKRASAMAVVERASRKRPEADALKAGAAALRAEAAALLADVEPWRAEGDKAPAWEKEDAAAALERQAELADLEEEQLLHGSLTHAPELPEAHAALAERYRAAHAAAEHARLDTARAEARLRQHLTMLPESHPGRSGLVGYLQGDGALTLVTDPPGAEVLLHRYVPYRRRLVTRFERSLGTTPLRGVSLPMGSYLCVLRHPDRPDVRYPVHIERQQHWDGVPPEGGDSMPIRLPRREELGPEDCYVPAGWFQCGGDRDAPSMPSRRLWADAQVFRRFPVTNTEYLAFVNDLVAQGREEEALRHAPRERAATAGALGPLAYGFDGSRFCLEPDADGDAWEPTYPVVLIDFAGAEAFATWEALRTGQEWRLPDELSWEKAGRGVDGRIYPWGDGYDASWSCTRTSHAGRPMPAPVDAYPVDESAYGVRGMGGNVAQWCVDLYSQHTSVLESQRVVTTPNIAPENAGAVRVVRGGSWSGPAANVRLANTGSASPSLRYIGIGLRLVRSYP